MPEPLTYGHLTSTAVRHAARAATRTRQTPLPPAGGKQPAAPPGLAAETDGLLHLLHAVRRHARYLADHVGTDQPCAQLADRLDTTLAGHHPTWHDPPHPDPWHHAADLLATAHDLLAAHQAPDGQPRSPDTWLLSSPDAVRAATTRLADLTLTAAVTATTLAARTDTVGHDPAAVRGSLLAVARLTGPARHVYTACLHATDSPLDELRPLLGDQHADPLDQALEHLRHATHQLARTDRAPTSHLALVVVADLAAWTAARTHQVTAAVAVRTRPATQNHLRRAARTAVDTRTAWQDTSAALRALTSTGTGTGTGGGDLHQLALDTAHHLHQATHAAARGDPRQLPTALTAVRRAALLLPDLATHSTDALLHSVRTGDLHHPGTHRPRPVGPRHTAWLADNYQTAADTSRALLAATLAFGAPPQLAHRATHLTGKRPLPRTAPADIPLSTVRVDTYPDHVTVHDPHHGTIDTPTAPFAAALTRTDTALKNLLAQKPWLRLTGREPPVTLAALTALHLPDQLTHPAVPPPSSGSAPGPPAGPALEI